MVEMKLDASERIESSLIFVCSGSSTFVALSSPCSCVLKCGTTSVAMAPADREKGDTSIGVMLVCDEGESKDCERMRTLGDGVRGRAITVAIVMRLEILGRGFRRHKARKTGINGLLRRLDGKPSHE